MRKIDPRNACLQRRRQETTVKEELAEANQRHVPQFTPNHTNGYH